MRKLATIRTIKEIRPIKNADKVECAIVDGWTVVIEKNVFKAGDKVIYCEIDSWIPTDLAPFLSKGKEPNEYCGIKGERLRTVVIRGQISQGLILPLNEKIEGPYVDNDVTSVLGIILYESFDMNKMGSMIMKGNFPSFINKTEQERIQNIHNKLIPTWEITEKLDGTSMTIYYYNGEIGVCSRNVEFKEDDSNLYWSVAKKNDLIYKIKEFGDGYAFQGEIIGPKIQGNPYRLTFPKFYLFNIFNIKEQQYLLPRVRQSIAANHKITHVPVYDDNGKLGTLEEMLKFAERKSMINQDVEQEGFVYKLNTDNQSFKVISNKFLLQN